MFSFFKNKLKGALDSIKQRFESKDGKGEKRGGETVSVTTEAADVKGVRQPEKKKGVLALAKGKITEAVSSAEASRAQAGTGAVVVGEPQHVEERPAGSPDSVSAPVKAEAEEAALVKEQGGERKGFFARLTEKIVAKKITHEDFTMLFGELETMLLESNVGIEVVEQIREGMRKQVVGQEVRRGKLVDFLKRCLRESIAGVLRMERIDLEELVRTCRAEGRPCVIVVLGYNGSGKSLSCARLGQWFMKKHISTLLAAGDTFRSAGIEQLVMYGEGIGVPVVAQTTGADSCSVIYDAVSKAKAKKIDVVICDTAGRMHTSKDLMMELQKIVRVNKPDLSILVLDSLMGTDVVQQVRAFDESVGVDALIFTKVDAYEKGGALLSAAAVGRKPILFLGTGQGFGDFQVYDAERLLDSFGL